MTDSNNIINDERTLEEEIVRRNEEGHTRAKIEAYLILEHDYSTNEAKAAVQGVLGRSGRDSQSLEKVVRFIRQNYGTMSKQELIEGMCEVTGGKFSSMNHMYNYIRLAQEYARQVQEESNN